MTQLSPDRWTTILKWQIPRRYPHVFVGVGNHRNTKDRNTRRLDKLEEDPYGTLMEWANRDTDSLRTRLRRFSDKHETETVRGCIRTPEDEPVRGTLRIVALGPNHAEILHAYHSWNTQTLERKPGPLVPFDEPGITTDNVLVAQLKPDRETEIKQPWLSLPVTVHNGKTDEIEKTRAKWTNGVGQGD